MGWFWTVASKLAWLCDGAVALLGVAAGWKSEVGQLQPFDRHTTLSLEWLFIRRLRPIRLREPDILFEPSRRIIRF